MVIQVEQLLQADHALHLLVTFWKWKCFNSLNGELDFKPWTETYFLSILIKERWLLYISLVRRSNFEPINLVCMSHFSAERNLEQRAFFVKLVTYPPIWWAARLSPIIETLPPLTLVGMPEIIMTSVSSVLKSYQRLSKQHQSQNILYQKICTKLLIAYFSLLSGILKECYTKYNKILRVSDLPEYLLRD